jgi:hypothetical protein
MDIFEFPSGRNQSDFWAVTSYWNPVHYQRKYANYRLFRERLGVPLVAIELAFGADFELHEEDAEILIQMRGGDILWQKERLLNLAMQALPSSCRSVAWVDCDVIFEVADWAERTAQLLKRAPLVQLFNHVYRMPPDWRPDQQIPPDAELLNGSPYLIASGMPVATCLGTPASQIHCGHGYAWAANRQLLEEHRLYDACIIGGGDSAIVRAAYGRFDDALRLQPLHRDHYLAWAQPFYKAVDSNVAFVDSNIFHLWHGTMKNRRYRARNEEFIRYQFDPYTDIAADRDAAWRWNSDKREMHDYVRDYFAARREDE